MHVTNVFDYERVAQARMEPGAWDYYAGGAGDELTLQENRAAFERIRLRPRVLVDVSAIDMRTTVLGTPVAVPILVAPAALQRLAHAEGERAMARGAGEAGTLMIASTEASCTLEEIAAAATGPLWQQLYLYRGQRHVAEELIARAEAAGYLALVVTVDLPRWGRWFKRSSEFDVPPGVREVNLPEGMEMVAESLTWKDIGWLRERTRLPLVLKGILTAEDARLAVEHGADGIVVSNHGGRILDGAVASIEALPEVAEAVRAAGGRCEVYMDGGVRRGTDVLKSLALGARAVLVGRPALWGLAAEGAEGVRNVLGLLRDELELAMALAGRPTLASIDHTVVKLR
ncbi:MAG TPA: alpha-hydroxy acid oxidase [Ktedonobacterales bacterium]